MLTALDHPQIKTLLKEALREILIEEEMLSESGSDLVDINWVASFTHRSKNTIYEWHSKGKIPSIKLGRDLLFSKKAIRQWAYNKSKNMQPAGELVANA